MSDGAYTSLVSAPTGAAAVAGPNGGCHYWTLAPSVFAGSPAAAAPPQFCPAPVYYQVICGDVMAARIVPLAPRFGGRRVLNVSV